jgi:hypothetical protein
MARRVLLPERCSKFCIGPDPWRRLGKFRPVSCMTSEDKSSHGAWRLKVPIQRPDTSSANGRFYSFCYMHGLEHATLFQVQALPRASCAPRSEHGRPTLASYTRKEAIHRRSRELTHAHTARKEANSPHHRFPGLHVGIRERADNPRDRRGRRPWYRENALIFVFLRLRLNCHLRFR